MGEAPRYAPARANTRRVVGRPRVDRERGGAIFLTPKVMPQDVPAQFLVLLTCRDAKHQVELLARFQAEGLDCKALLS